MSPVQAFELLQRPVSGITVRPDPNRRVLVPGLDAINDGWAIRCGDFEN